MSYQFSMKNDVVPSHVVRKSFGKTKASDILNSRNIGREHSAPEQRCTPTSAAPNKEGEREDFKTLESNSDNPTKLFSYIAKRNWEVALKRCSGEKGKREAATWIVEYNADGSIRWKLLPIHQACEYKAPSELIKHLISAYPASLMLKDSGGFLPLHLACRERSSKSVIAALLSAEPGATKSRDEEGRLPLHLACRQGVPAQIVDSLIACHYKGAATIDKYGLLPIHWACAQNATAAVIESLLRVNPVIHDIKDQWGRTPLSLVQASTNPEKALIMEALTRDPGFWSKNVHEEINTLKKSLESSGISDEKVKTLEKENSALRHKVSDLIGKVKYTDDDIERIIKENERLQSKVNSLKKTLHEFVFIFQGMEDLKHNFARNIQVMDESLKKAMKIAGSDNVSDNNSI